MRLEILGKNRAKAPGVVFIRHRLGPSFPWSLPGGSLPPPGLWRFTAEKAFGKLLSRAVALCLVLPALSFLSRRAVFGARAV